MTFLVIDAERTGLSFWPLLAVLAALGVDAHQPEAAEAAEEAVTAAPGDERLGARQHQVGEHRPHRQVIEHGDVRAGA